MLSVLRGVILNRFLNAHKKLLIGNVLDLLKNVMSRSARPIVYP